MNHPVALLTVAVALGGCASPTDLATREPYVKPGLIMLTADQAERRGLDLQRAAGSVPLATAPSAPLESSRVAVPPTIKVYTLNRQVDPADRELMHEEHVVYRRESAPQWRLDAPAGDKLLIGPRVTDGRQDMHPLLDRELTTFLADQRRALDANQIAIKSLFDAVQALDRRQQELAARLPVPTDGPVSGTHDDQK